MTTNRFSATIFGWVAILIGVSVILAVILLTLMYTVNPSFGKVNDVFNSVIGILSMILAWGMYAEHHAKSPLMSQIALALVTVGAVFTIIGSILIIYDFTSFLLAGWYSGVGNALIGLWLVAFCYSLSHTDRLLQNLVIFGIVTGAFMAVGLLGIPGIFAGIDNIESMPWYLYVAFFGWLGTYILFPIWAIWLGRNLGVRSHYGKNQS
ncbi:MAG: hypothetical protein JNJ43_07780 [Anaerolineales bacterium]|nr:hypothetical protein [Anaerolineales bacterium]